MGRRDPRRGQESRIVPRRRISWGGRRDVGWISCGRRYRRIGINMWVIRDMSRWSIRWYASIGGSVSLHHRLQALETFPGHIRAGC